MIGSILALRTICALMLPIILAGAAVARDTANAQAIPNNRAGVVRLYGAPGPEAAFKKVAEAFTRETGIRVAVGVGFKTAWRKTAQARADILWGSSEEDIDALRATYKNFSFDEATPIDVRSAVIAVKKGNPKHIHQFGDLLRRGLRIVITKDGGVTDTFGIGAVGREYGRADIRRFRGNIVGFAKGSGPSYRMFVDKNADVWITWPDWPVTLPDRVEIVTLSRNRPMWRDVTTILAHDADSLTKRFLEFLNSDRGAAIMNAEGWVCHPPSPPYSHFSL